MKCFSEKRRIVKTTTATTNPFAAQKVGFFFLLPSENTLSFGAKQKIPMSYIGIRD